MTAIAIEMSDTGMLAVTDAGGAVGPSPGYALLDGKRLLVGVEAQARSRLKPRWIDHRFWDELDSSPMPKPFPRSLSRADVAHAHLSHLWGRVQQELGATAESASVLLAVPGSFSANQLGLILGIARAAEIPVTGMVDASVAAVAQASGGHRVLHLDVLLHRMIWTELERDGELVRRRVEVMETGGLARIWDAWAKRIAELLVRQTRFDPFHHGSAEQTLYDGLPEWLAELSRADSVLVTLESEGKERSVELTADGIGPVTSSLTQPVVEVARVLAGSGVPATLILSDRAAAIPGLAHELSQLSQDGVAALDVGAAARGALDQRSRIESPGSELPFVIRLPAEVRQGPLSPISISPPRSAAPPSSGTSPTHVLCAGLAYPIRDVVLWLGSSVPSSERGLQVGGPMPGLSRKHCAVYRRDGTVVVEDHSTYGTYLNDRRVEGSVVASAGDRLRLGSPGIELLLIAVAEDDV